MIHALVLLLAVSTTATVAPAAAPVAAPGDTIVVTGVSMKWLRDQVDGCKAGGCTPRADIVASIRYAEGLFRAGTYREARRVLEQSVGRTKKAAAQEPVALSELYLALANVAMHDGDQAIVQRATYQRAITLRDNLPADAPATMLGDMGLGDWYARTGDRTRAIALYGRVVERARSAGRPDIAGAATLRLANVAHARKRDRETERLLDGMIADTRSDMAGFRLAARALQARFARERGETGATDALLAALASEPQRPRPVLLFAPPLPEPTDPVPHDRLTVLTDTVTRSSDFTGIKWADVGFLIRPDGTVETPERLRGSRGEVWVAPVLAAMSKRRYAPFGGAGDTTAGQYRVERVTETADYATPSGSLIRRRSRNPHYETLDITGGAPETRLKAVAG